MKRKTAREKMLATMRRGLKLKGLPHGPKVMAAVDRLVDSYSNLAAALLVEEVIRRIDLRTRKGCP